MSTQQMAINSDFTPILQQIAKFASSNEGFSPNNSLVVFSSDGVRYHCAASAESVVQFPPNITNNKEKLFIPNSESKREPLLRDSKVENETRSSIIIPAYISSNQNPTPQKTDAATMTDKEMQGAGESGFIEQDCKAVPTYSVHAVLPSSVNWPSIAGTPSSAVAAYLSRIPASTLPLTLHHFLKFASIDSGNNNVKTEEPVSKKKKKRKYKKKPYIPRPPRPKPGEIRLTTALDGSTLYCCPECHMAYPERDLLQQHLVVHRLERRFVCDICGAGLKRKEHLDRHKQGHNPDRPYVCSVCMKAFKRNEHLARHFISHSGDKTQVCSECGKGFYRKDHLRKHTQSHIAKRLRAELTNQKSDSSNNSLGHNVSLSPLIPIGEVPPPAGVTAVALIPGGTTVPILSS